MLSVILISCSENENEKQKDNKSDVNSKPLVHERKINQPDPVNDEKIIAETDFKGKIEKGEIILLTKEGEPYPYEFKGDKIMAMQMPDGKLHQVEVKNERTWMYVPGRGEMQALRLNGKVYLFDDDDRAYEVKVMNKELVAEATELTDELLALDDK